MADVTPSPSQRLGDAKLLTLARGGERRASVELWRRHSTYSLAVAQGLAPEDDWTSTNTRAWAIILNSDNDDRPDGGFRAYLYSVVRAISSVGGSASPAPLTLAYRALTARWREVLWFGHVESMKPAQIGTLMGMAPDEVPSLLHRARAGLRRQWVNQHLATLDKDSDCAWAWEHSNTYVRGLMSGEDKQWMDAHLRRCRTCRSAGSDAILVASRLATIVLPVIAGPGGATQLAYYLRAHGPTIRATSALPTALQPEGPPDTVAKRQPSRATTTRTADTTQEASPAATPPAATPPAARPSPRASTGENRGPGTRPDTTTDALVGEPSPRRPTDHRPSRSSPDQGSDAGRDPQFLVDSDDDLHSSPSSPRDRDQNPSVRLSSGVRTILAALGITAAIIITTLIVVGQSAPLVVDPFLAAGPSASARAEATVTITMVDTGAFNTVFPVVSGEAAPGATVSVVVGDVQARVTADDDGAWSTLGTRVDSCPIQGEISASTTGEAATALYQIATPPSIAIGSAGGQPSVTITGLPGAGVEVLVDGTGSTLATLDQSGRSSLTLPVPAGSHFLQVRYVDSERVGPTSEAITAQFG